MKRESDVFAPDDPPPEHHRPVEEDVSSPLCPADSDGAILKNELINNANSTRQMYSLVCG